MTPARRAAVAAALQISFPADRQAPAVARSAVKGFCSEGPLDAGQLHTAVLLVSELVSNAVQHSAAPDGAPIALSVKVRRTTVRVEVTDGGSGFEPRPRDRDQSTGGYGLQLVARAAARWGVDRRGGTRVWFELAGTGPARATAPWRRLTTTAR